MEKVHSDSQSTPSDLCHDLCDLVMKILLFDWGTSMENLLRNSETPDHPRSAFPGSVLKLRLF